MYTGSVLREDNLCGRAVRSRDLSYINYIHTYLDRCNPAGKVLWSEHNDSELLSSDINARNKHRSGL